MLAGYSIIIIPVGYSIATEKSWHQTRLYTEKASLEMAWNGP